MENVEPSEIHDMSINQVIDIIDNCFNCLKEDYRRFCLDGDKENLDRFAKILYNATQRV